MAASLVSATFVWGAIGWLGDRWLGTAPVLMSIGFVVGFFAGMYLLYLKTNDSDDEPTRRSDAGAKGGDRAGG